jgi:hypothetical protein
MELLKEQLVEFAERHPELGYRSGFSFMLAFLNCLHEDVPPALSLKIFEYLMYEVGFARVHADPNYLRHLLAVLGHMIGARRP